MQNYKKKNKQMGAGERNPGISQIVCSEGTTSATPNSNT